MGARAAELTVEEKAALCLGADIWRTAPVERLGIGSVVLADGPHGLRKPAEGGVGIGGSVPATCFPTASALGSSWDPELVERVGAALGAEAAAQGVGVLLGPGINIKRSPLCGRNFEYFSEDPLISGVLGAAMVRGVQSRGVGACVKHYAANNQETDRLRVSADVDERTLREIYLAGFERVVREAGPWTVMCAYNAVNGVLASQNRWLLSEVLRDEWGFDGLVMSDWGAVADRVAALAAGLDLEMPPNLGVSDAALVAAVRSGELAEAELDTAAGRVLALGDRVGAGAPAEPVDADAHHALARRVAAQCAVLLRNDGALLPLDVPAGGAVAVVGEFARTPRYQGAGSSQVNPTRVDVPLDELRRALPDEVDVRFAAGFTIEPDVAADEQLAAEAERVAADADVVVAFLGLPASAESEGFDRTHIDLPANQTALLARLAAANPRVVVVLSNGSVVRTSDWERHAAAVLECWLSGQAAGGAIADVLVGAAEPGGRLAETVPLRLADTPSHLNFPGELGHVRYGEGVFVGYRGFDAADRPVAYPFGHGLSYTSFGYADLEVAVTGSADDGDLAVDVAVAVTNTGARPGTEVVQLYVGDPHAAVARPVRELRGFAKVALEPGQTRAVRFRLGARDLSYWSTAAGRWVLEGGRFDLAVGASSRDLRLTTSVEVPAEPVRPPLGSGATLDEWLADPDGAERLRAAVGVDRRGRPRGILASAELSRMLGNFPLARLATFPGLGITPDVLRAIGP
ncbi:glycoside hydrolase family 3 C-terminal domain-containing protein [Pseudonocardia lacus]|uniref:glycoside hydrolase family 3 C-terminal domain-containing protein n=1 Tax=Pseudonocardia lacus TaxID=2835865 RepID=UPI001BDD0AD4|nr:glycoside hydrolase family 3 C-terminal domain-containing protein [Pseudonocardia lacus]